MHHNYGDFNFWGIFMHKKSISAFAVLMTSTALALVPAVASATMKGNLGFVRPLADWRIGEIVSPAQGVEGYCASVNKFEQGFTLALAKAKNGNYSFAIDFPEKRFKPGQVIPVSLQHSQGYSVQTQATAVNSRSAIIQLGQEDLMFSALRGEGHLNVGFPDVDMKMSLVTFSKSAEKLDNCVQSLKLQPVEVQEVRAIPPKMQNVETNVVAQLSPMPATNIAKHTVKDLDVISPAAGEPDGQMMEITAEVETSAEVKNEEELRQQRLNALNSDVVAVEAAPEMVVEEITVKPITPTAPTIPSAEVVAETDNLDIETETTTQDVLNSPIVEAKPIEQPVAEMASPIEDVDIKVPAIKPVAKIEAKPAMAPDTTELQEKIELLEKSNRELEVARKALEKMPNDTSASQQALIKKMDRQKQEIASLQSEISIKSNAITENLNPGTQIPTKPKIEVGAVAEQNIAVDEHEMTVDQLVEQYEPRAGGNMAAVANVSPTNDENTDTLTAQKAPVSLTTGLNKQMKAPANVRDAVTQSGFGNVRFLPQKVEQRQFKQELWTASLNGTAVKGSISSYKNLSSDNFVSHVNGFVKAFAQTQCETSASASNNGLQVLSSDVAIANLGCSTGQSAKHVSLIFFVNEQNQFSVLHHEAPQQQRGLLHEINGTLIQYISSAIHGHNTMNDFKAEDTSSEKTPVNPI